MLYILLGLAGVYILSSLFAFCPLYTLAGVSTHKVKQ
ncbi:YgaP-like transmembrane domain [Aureicoccus marinus]